MGHEWRESTDVINDLSSRRDGVRKNAMASFLCTGSKVERIVYGGVVEIKLPVSRSLTHPNPTQTNGYGSGVNESPWTHRL